MQFVPRYPANGDFGCNFAYLPHVCVIIIMGPSWAAVVGAVPCTTTCRLRCGLDVTLVFKSGTTLPWKMASHAQPYGSGFSLGRTAQQQTSNHMLLRLRYESTPGMQGE
uniref:Uncharacterized protein n=1 Tax=Anopheles maculatus TaxID=74869 RepID=A0A182SU44_9DIPT